MRACVRSALRNGDEFSAAVHCLGSNGGPQAMHGEELTGTPKDEKHFWEMTEQNFELARHVLEDYPLEDREQAIEDENHAPMMVIAYRNVSADYDLRPYAYDLGRKLLPRVRELVKARVITPEFCQAWGVLMFCHGYIASHIFDDSDDVALIRNQRKSAAARSSVPHRCWLAFVFARPEFANQKRDVVDQDVGAFLAAMRDNRSVVKQYPDGWFDKILKKGTTELRSTFTGKNFPLEEMEYARSFGSEDLPPLPD